MDTWCGLQRLDMGPETPIRHKYLVQTHLAAKWMNKTEAKCMASMAGIGFQHSNIVINNSDPRWGVENRTCSTLFWANMNITIRGKPTPQVPYLHIPEGQKFTCFTQGNKTHLCTSKGCPQGGAWMGALNITSECQNGSATTTGEGSPTNMSAPSNGTYLIQNGWWLCGHNVYPMLPINWTGVCAPVWVTDHTYKIYRGQLPSLHQRQRRSVTIFKPHNSIWGSDVPAEHKVWSTSAKVVHSLFPWNGIGKQALYIETLNYRFQSFVNFSLQIESGQSRELQATRLMVLQNRMALDLITAAQGGVCHIIGASCCTYIPGDNDTHINEAMASLRNLQQTMSRETGQQQWDFLSWLTTGTWWQLLLKIVTPFFGVLILFCVFMTCVIPCFKSVITKTVTSTMVSLQLLRQTTEHDDYISTN